MAWNFPSLQDWYQEIETWKHFHLGQKDHSAHSYRWICKTTLKFESSSAQRCTRQKFYHEQNREIYGVLQRAVGFWTNSQPWSQNNMKNYDWMICLLQNWATIFCKKVSRYCSNCKCSVYSVHPCNQALRKPPTELGSWGRTKARLKSLIIVTTTTALATEYCFAFGGRLILPSESKHSHLQAELRGSNVNALHCPDGAIFSQAWLHLWSESKS